MKALPGSIAHKEDRKVRVVVVGGGTGTHTVLRGLKQYHSQLDLTAVVTMADSGGSTGRLRDEFGQLPVGDVRMALSALSADLDQHGELVRELFLYRFDKGNGLSGHNFGNLLLTALTDMLGSEMAAITAAGQILRVRGRVVPVTADNTNLQAVYDDGEVRVGECVIDEPPTERWPHRIRSVALTPEAVLAPAARQALEGADVILFGPGDLYTSVLATTAASGFVDAIKASSARLDFVCNLMTKAGQTTGMSAADHRYALQEVIGRPLTTTFYNTAPFPEELCEAYTEEAEYPVRDDLETDTSVVVRSDLLARESVKNQAGDTVRRSLIRHDSDRLAQTLLTAWGVLGRETKD